MRHCTGSCAIVTSTDPDNIAQWDRNCLFPFLACREIFFLFWAIAQFVRVSEYMVIHGIVHFLCDPYNMIEALATILTLMSTLLETCNDGVIVHLWVG